MELQEIKTAIELIKWFNEHFGLGIAWPEKIEVKAELYADCCQMIFDTRKELDRHSQDLYYIALGKNRGLMFKNVELILKGN